MRNSPEIRSALLAVFGKLLGTIIGICLGLALGSSTWAGVFAAVGCVLGHLIDARNADWIDTDLAAPPLPPQVPSPDEAVRSIQVRDLCALLIEVARADAAVNRVEMRAIRLWLEKSVPTHLDAVPAFLKAAIAAPNESVETLSERLAETVGGPDRRELLDGLYALSEADGPLQADEREVLRAAARGLGLAPRREPEDPPEAAWDATPHLGALGLPAEATNEEIKSAYRRLAREHHPDRFAHLGGSALEAASVRFRAVHEAYEELKRRRGF
jgi:DnaJ like chaperone protein